MMRKLFLILALVFGPIAFGQKISKSVLSADSVLIGDQIAWTLEFALPEDSPVAIGPYSSVLAADTTLKGGVEVVREFELDTVSVKEKMAQLRAHILLTSFDSGSFVLPSPLIIYGKEGRPDTLRIEPKLLYVNTIPIDTASFQPYDIKEQETYPVTFSEILPWILLACGAILLLWAVVRFIIMRKKNRDFFGRKIEVEPPHIVALKKLEKIRGEKLWQSGKPKAYYTGITEAVRLYIEKRYAFGAMEKTTSEIMESLSDKRIDDKILSDLGQMLSTADLVKFAKFNPSMEDNEQAIPAAVNFINFAYMQQLEQTDAQRANAEGDTKFREGK